MEMTLEGIGRWTEVARLWDQINSRSSESYAGADREVAYTTHRRKVDDLWMRLGKTQSAVGGRHLITLHAVTWPKGSWR